MRRGLPLPDKIQNAPELRHGLELYLRAFYELDSCRSIGMAEGQIPWTALDQWAGYLALDEDEREDLFYLVRRLDNAFLEHQDKKRPKPKAGPAGKGGK